VKLALTALAPTLLLGLSFCAACDKNKPDGTTPPGSGGSTASTDGGGSTDGGSSDGGTTDGGKTDGGKTDGGKPDGGKPAKACDAKIADAPQALFEEKVLIRPPINVVLAEENPTMAVAAVSGGFVSACEATVDRMNLLIFKHDKKKNLKAFTDDFIDNYLAKGGYKDGKKDAANVDTATEHHLAVEYPPEGGQPASVLYIASAVRFENVFVMVYQTRPDEYKVLKPTFEASAKSLLVVPPS
jgi:hypothetical protein